MSHTSNAAEAALIRQAQELLTTAANALHDAERAIRGTDGAVTVRIVTPRISAALAEIDTAAVVLAGATARLALHDAAQ